MKLTRLAEHNGAKNHPLLYYQRHVRKNTICRKPKKVPIFAKDIKKKVIKTDMKSFEGTSLPTRNCWVI